MTLSAVILTKNEEENIENCIESLDFCDEIIVIDDASLDRTRLIAEKLGAKVYVRELNNNFSSQRNFALRQAEGKWILFIDPDERVSKELAKEIVQVINDPTINFAGFYIKRHDFLWGKKLSYGECGSIKLLRLARRSSGRWRRRVHEYWNVAGRTYNLKNSLLHYPHPSLRVFVKSVNWMSDLHGQANLEEGKRSSLARIIIWPAGKFFSNYILRLGFLDGTNGLIAALMMSFHSYLAWSNLWLKLRRK